MNEVDGIIDWLESNDRIILSQHEEALIRRALNAALATIATYESYHRKPYFQGES